MVRDQSQQEETKSLVSLLSGLEVVNRHNPTFSMGVRHLVRVLNKLGVQEDTVTQKKLLSFYSMFLAYRISMSQEKLNQMILANEALIRDMERFECQIGDMQAFYR